MRTTCTGCSLARETGMMSATQRLHAAWHGGGAMMKALEGEEARNGRWDSVCGQRARLEEEQLMARPRSEHRV